MDAEELIKTFEKFLEASCYSELVEASHKGEKSIAISFRELMLFSPELAEYLIEEPEEALKAGELAIEGFDLPSEDKRLRIRLKELPDNFKILIRNIRATDLGKMLVIEGTVRQKSDVRPQVTSAKFECPSCGNIINVLQLDTKFKEPSRCGCGRKGKFRLVSKELIDAQRIVLEEATKDLEGGEQPKRLNVLLKEDLVSPISEKKTNPGTTIRITGVIKEIPKILRTGGQSTEFEIMLEANNVETLEEDYTNIEITEEEEEKIKELASEKGIVKKLVRSLAPGIYGHEKIKEALLLQFVGGVKKMRDDGVQTRGDIHILLIGDPGAGKSMLLKRAAVVAPKARYVSGKGVSGAGLTATVVRDEFLGGWSLEAGALVLANKGIVMIDELDKMSKDDTAAMHEGLEQQTISISKANIQATLRCETTVLGAANPRLGRFDPYESISKQIGLPPTLINRFDLIFPIKDLPDTDKDRRMARFILELHKDPKGETPDIDTDMLRKYLVYCRQKIMPKLTDSAIDEIESYYLEMRSSGNIEEGGIRTIPISARQLEALVRLSEAAAKLRLSTKVTRQDAKRAIELIDFCLKQVGLDPTTGKIDIDRITTGITASKRSRIGIVRDVIRELSTKIGKTIPFDEIREAVAEHNIKEDELRDILEELKRSGDIFEPRRDFFSIT